MKKSGIIILGLLLTGASINDARQANEAYDNGNYVKAEELYRKAIDGNPENAKLYFNLGNALTKQGKFEEALRVFEQYKSMIDDPQQWALADYNIGNIYSQTKKWDKAINSYKNALRYTWADEDAKHNYELAKQKKQEQQKQQQNQQQQGNQNQNQDQQQQQQDQDQQQNQQQNQPNQPQNQSRQRQPQYGKMSKAQAEKILNALEQKEKELLKEFKKQKTESGNSKNEKDW